MHVIVYYALLLTVMILAAWRGGRDERLAAFICTLGTAATVLLVAPLPDRFAGLEVAVAIVDLGVLAGFALIALQSDRYWPLWVAGIQLTTTIGHGLKVLHPNLLPIAYGAALALWSYPILLIIAAGVLRRSLILSWRPRTAG